MTKHQQIFPATEHQPYRFTQRDYRLLSDHGAFDRVGKTELVEGVIVAVNAQFSRHVRVQSLLFRALADACDRLDGELSAWIEGSVSLDDESMPQPDIFVAAELPDDGPIPLDKIFMIAEVADSSLADDLGIKFRLYARHGVPEYWVADVNAGVLHQFWSPSKGAYLNHHTTPFGDTITAATIDGMVVATDRL